MGKDLNSSHAYEQLHTVCDTIRWLLAEPVGVQKSYNQGLMKQGG